MKNISEGLALIKIPENVFYNPVQEFNRDLTISVINSFIKTSPNNPKEKISNIYKNKFDILEGLSATGLRSVRFAKEIKGSISIIANDVDPAAAELIKENVKENCVEDKVDVTCSDANFLIHKCVNEGKKFHVIDLDPYGSAAKFLDSAVQGLVNGGLLCVTCTDAAVLCGASSGTSMSKYGSMSFGKKLASCHEMGIRILLNSIQDSAGKYGLYMEPLLSLSIDFYFRVFVRLWNNLGAVKTIASKLGMVYLCSGCDTFRIQKLGEFDTKPSGNQIISCAKVTSIGNVCEICKGNYSIAGPIWIDPVHNNDFCNQIITDLEVDQKSKESDKTKQLGTIKRIIGMVSVAREELQDVPLFYELDKLCKTIKIVTPPMNKVKSALLNAGYRVSSSHCSSVSLKTDAPLPFLWKVIQSASLTRFSTYKPTDAANNIMSCIKDVEDEIDFTENTDANPLSKQQGLVRFQANPAPNWGPKPKAARLYTEKNQTQ